MLVASNAGEGRCHKLATVTSLLQSWGDEVSGAQDEVRGRSGREGTFLEYVVNCDMKRSSADTNTNTPLSARVASVH